MAQTQATQAAPLRIIIAGRVKESSKRTGDNGTTFRTLVNTPAPDHFGHPGTFEVRSMSALGRPGDDVTVTCELKGYSRNYKNRDGQSVNTAEHVLQAV